MNVKIIKDGRLGTVKCCDDNKVVVAFQDRSTGEFKYNEVKLIIDKS